jgi:hypothetical protein
MLYNLMKKEYRMAQLGEAIARYQKVLESPAYRDLAWADALQQAMREKRLTESGRVVAPILRPHFLNARQHASLVKTAEGLSAIIERVQDLIVQTPALMSRMRMLPAEKMLAAIPPGYQHGSVTSLMDGHLADGALQFSSFRAQTPAGVAYADALADLFLELPLVKEFRRGRYKLTRIGSGKYLPLAVLRSWKDFGGKRAPQAAIVEFQQPFTGESNESLLLAEMFEKAGIPTRVVAPDQLTYQDRVLRSGDYRIDIVFRRLRTRELLVRHDLTHPLLTAYREGRVCMINSFRAELTERRAIFDLLTDEAITGKFPHADRKLIRDHIPWTRVVGQNSASYHDEVIDLPEFILNHRERLVLRPNDDTVEQRSFSGADSTQAAWERALQTALRSSYVVQEVVAPLIQPFPVYQYGELQTKELDVSIQPHTFLGKMQGVSAALTQSANGAVVPVGIAPALLLASA